MATTHLGDFRISTEKIMSGRAPHTEAVLGEFHLPAIPADIEFEARAGQIREGLAVLSRRATEAVPEIKKAQGKLERDMKPLSKSLAILEEESKDALPAEAPAFRTRIESTASELKKLRTAHAACPVRLERLNRAHATASTRFDQAAQFLHAALQAFPQAQHLDLNCLGLFKNNSGLPALALYSPEHATTALVVDNDITAYDVRGSWGSGDFLPQHTRRAIAVNIVSATGVIPFDTPDAHWKSIAFRDGNPNFCCASWIKLTSGFSDGGRTIPKEARRIIRCAIEQKIFDQVVLLAEVPEWRIEYRNLDGRRRGSPLLRGDVTTSRPAKDPLIVGLKQLQDGRRFALMIGAFDTTPIEQLIKEEYCQRP